MSTQDVSPSLQWEVMEVAAQRASRAQSRCAQVKERGENQAGEERSQRRAPPVLAPGGSASEQFPGRGTQEAKRNPSDMGASFPHRKASIQQGTQIICQRINTSETLKT